MRVAYPDLLAVLQAGATVVTPTSLLASIANEQFTRAQLAQGREAWERPAIYGLDAWMAKCWQDARFTQANVPVLLSPLQERELWRQLIQADRPDLFDPSGMANLARRAANTVAEYQIPLDEDDWNEREDARQFRDWLNQVRSICKSKGWMLRSDLWRAALPDAEFVGFSQVSAGLKRLGAKAMQPVAKKAEAVLFDSFEEELQYAARTARELFEAGETSIAVFVPELSVHASFLERTFNSVFYPSGPEEDSAFHLSGQPLIVAGLLLLELAKPRIDHAAAGAILRSPFIEGAKEERSARALADIQLRRARELDVTLRDMDWACRDCPGMKAVIKAVRKLLYDLPERQSPSAWGRLFRNLLKACGGPQSDEWNNALAELSALGLVAPEVDRETAINRVREVLSRPGEVGDWSSPVQILDASSAAGMEFDHALIIGLSEEKFLRPAALSPLIPFRLQRRHGVMAESRDDAAKALFSSALKIRATCSKDLPLFVKPFIKGTAKRAPAVKQKFAIPALEQIEDANAPPLASPEVAGGARVIQAQSQCPFKAFAEYRLKARVPEDASFGYDAMERGGFTHKALEFVWKELESQKKLKATTSEQLRDLVRRSVLEAVKSEETDGPLHHLASIAERERLETLILTWLDVEKERLIPFTVEVIEQKSFFKTPGLQIELRIDRVDRLPNGSTLLIDYKTGKQTKTKLEKQRPQEPQLWVYAAALGEPVDGLLFGQLSPVEPPRLVGHAVGKHCKGNSIADHKSDWEGFVGDALKNIATLAQEFVSGDAVVRPEPSACSYCKTMPLCRINESTRLDEEEE